MDLGTAIKTIRKHKGLSQKDLAELCGLSVNGLCQIEINNTFPQKSTIRQICSALNIPVSYLLFFSISDDDLPEDTKKTFNALSSSIRNILVPDTSKESVTA